LGMANGSMPVKWRSNPNGHSRSTLNSPTKPGIIIISRVG